MALLALCAAGCVAPRTYTVRTDVPIVVPAVEPLAADTTALERAKLESEWPPVVAIHPLDRALRRVQRRGGRGALASAPLPRRRRCERAPRRSHAPRASLGRAEPPIVILRVDGCSGPPRLRRVDRCRAY